MQAAGTLLTLSFHRSLAIHPAPSRPRLGGCPVRPTVRVFSPSKQTYFQSSLSLSNPLFPFVPTGYIFKPGRIGFLDGQDGRTSRTQLIDRLKRLVWVLANLTSLQHPLQPLPGSFLAN